MVELYEVRWTLRGNEYLELRTSDNPETLKRHIESLSHRDWPIENIRVTRAR